MIRSEQEGKKTKMGSTPPLPFKEKNSFETRREGGKTEFFREKGKETVGTVQQFSRKERDKGKSLFSSSSSSRNEGK